MLPTHLRPQHGGQLSAGLCPSLPRGLAACVQHLLPLPRLIRYPRHPHTAILGRRPPTPLGVRHRRLPAPDRGFLCRPTRGSHASDRHDARPLLHCGAEGTAHGPITPEASVRSHRLRSRVGHQHWRKLQRFPQLQDCQIGRWNILL